MKRNGVLREQIKGSKYRITLLKRSKIANLIGLNFDVVYVSFFKFYLTTLLGRASHKYHRYKK